MKCGDYVFVEPLDRFGGTTNVVFLYDGEDVWWIDDDDDLLYWDCEGPPNYAHEVRMANKRVRSKDITDEEVQKMFDTSPVIEFYWEKFYE